MPSKAKTNKSPIIEAPENKPPMFTKIAVPLVQPVIGKREEGSVYVTKTAYEKGMIEYLSSNEAYASIYSSSDEYMKLFSDSDADNAIKKEFMAYAVDRRRRIGEVCGATTDTIIVKIPTTDTDLINLVQSSAAVLRFCYDAAGKNKLELKKGTSIHIIEVAIVGLTLQPNENPVPTANGPISADTIESDTVSVSEQ